MICPHCGNKISDNSCFCAFCGKTIGNLQKNTICPYCGKEMPDGAAFCGFCGGKITNSQPKDFNDPNGTNREPAPDPLFVRRCVITIVCAVIIIVAIFQKWVGEGYTLLHLRRLVEDNRLYFNHIFYQTSSTYYEKYTEAARDYTIFCEINGYFIIFGQVLYCCCFFWKARWTKIVGRIVAWHANLFALLFLTNQLMIQIDMYIELEREINSELMFAAAPFIVYFVSMFQGMLVERKKKRRVL